LHIKEVAAETFAKEHMHWEVHAELLLTVLHRGLQALQRLVLEDLHSATCAVGALTAALEDVMGLHPVAGMAVHQARVVFLKVLREVNAECARRLDDLQQTRAQVVNLAKGMQRSPAVHEHKAVDFNVRCEIAQRELTTTMEQLLAVLERFSV
jgi:hypothetical protein